MRVYQFRHIRAGRQCSQGVPRRLATIPVLKRVVLLLAAASAAVFVAAPAHAGFRSDAVEVVVTLEGPPLARAIAHSRVLSDRAKAERLDLRSPTSAGYLRELRALQSRVATRIESGLSGATVHWRYQIVLNGLAVVLPRSELARLEAVPGVRRVWPSVRYRPLLDRGPRLIHADLLWGAPGFTTAGNGVKIGIVDDGVDQSHPFVSPAGFQMPPGFPKGNTAFTTAKVIAARAFPPPTTSWKYAGLPFDPQESEHGTHVAGIAAGNANTTAAGTTVSGVAPRAYIGNYKVLTVPTEGFGLNGNSPEIAAGIEAAVRDGMDVINLSLGEPEIEPSRDLVVAAINAAADAGVIATVAAGNDFLDYGRGSVASPGSASRAITAAAASKSAEIASFSSSGPTPVSLQMKPDVTAPGASIVSSVPVHAGMWASFSGTSMAAPHVAGAAALLLQRHPTWSVADVKAALIGTGSPVAISAGGGEASTIREGGGLIDLVKANDPLVLATPANHSFGLLRVGTTASGAIDLADAGGGAGDWAVAVRLNATAPGTSVTVPPLVTVPGRIEVSVAAAPDAQERDVTGFVVLTRGTDTRRIPFWFRVTAPKLASLPQRTLAKTGTYTGVLRGTRSSVTTYRYPDDPRGAGLTTSLLGPEQVFRVQLAQPVANFGVAILDRNGVSPRIVYAGDENRQTGIPSLPLSINPYLFTFGQPKPVSGAIRPLPGSYDVVFDAVRPGGRTFSFRFWVNDVTPPTVRRATRGAPEVGDPFELTVTDAGSGVDPDTIRASIDGVERATVFSRRTGTVSLSTDGLPPGRHRIVLQVSDYQEAKNMENVPRILPNTRVFRATFSVR